MNRRGFLDSILKAGVGAMILPTAVTYARTWKRSKYIWLMDWVEVDIRGAKRISREFETYRCTIVPPEEFALKPIIHTITFERFDSQWS